MIWSARCVHSNRRMTVSRSCPISKSNELGETAISSITAAINHAPAKCKAIIAPLRGAIIDDGSANIFLQSDSIRNEGRWRAHLYRETELRAAVPFVDQKVELHRGLSAGFYTVKLTRANAPVCHFTVALEPFSL